MPTIRRTITADQPLSAVWAFLSDFTTTEQWDPGTVRTTRRSGDGGVGTVYDNVSKMAGRETELEYTVVAVEPQKRIQLRGVNKSVVATDTLSFTGDEQRTTVEYVADFEFQGLFKLLAPLMALPLKRLGDKGAQGMTEALAKL